MAATNLTDSPIREVQLEALVVMRIIKHSTTQFPTPATGCLVGMDVGSQLQITNSFPFPAAAPESGAATNNNQADPYHHTDQAALARVRARYRLPADPFLLMVVKGHQILGQASGTALTPRKNVAVALDAYGRMRRHVGGAGAAVPPLVILGLGIAGANDVP